MKVFELEVRKPIDLLNRLLEMYSENTRISLEGDFSKVDFGRLEAVHYSPNKLLKRNTYSPRQDFIIIPLTPNNKEVLIREIWPRIGIRERVLHIQVASSDEIVFSSYDNFDEECVHLRDVTAKTTYLLDEWKEEKIIRFYKLIETP